jgi:hypothetical protein
VLVGFAGWSVTPLLVWLYARSIGAQATWVRIGYGPVVRRSSGAMRLTELRTVPLSFAAHYLPRRETHGRDLRRIQGAFPVVATALAVALAALLAGALREPAAALVELAYVLAALLVWALGRDRGSKRRRIARILVAATPKQDPRLADPRFADWEHATVALTFGELEAAEGFVPVLRASGYPEHIIGPLAAGVHETRGEYEAALAIVTGLLHENRPDLALERLQLQLRIAERDRVPQPPAAAETLEYLARVPAGLISAGRRATVLAVARLAAGTPAEARAHATRQWIAAQSPLAAADALCTRALIEAATQRPEQASRILRRAQEFAPWYARVAIVRGLLGGGAVLPATLPATAPTSADAFADPWAVPPG